MKRHHYVFGGLFLVLLITSALVFPSVLKEEVKRTKQKNRKVAKVVEKTEASSGKCADEVDCPGGWECIDGQCSSAWVDKKNGKAYFCGKRFLLTVTYKGKQYLKYSALLVKGKKPSSSTKLYPTRIKGNCLVAKLPSSGVVSLYTHAKPWAIDPATSRPIFHGNPTPNLSDLHWRGGAKRTRADDMTIWLEMK